MPLDGKNYQPCETARILREAAKIMREHGHAKGIRQDYNGAVCIGGAISLAINPIDNLIDYHEFLPCVKILEEQLGISPWGRIVSWNNEPERTKEEVIEVLEKAAIFAEEKVIA